MERRTKFYLDKRNGKLFGVCAGIADYFGVDAMWVRVGTVLITLFGAAGFTIPAYIVIAILADRKPAALYDMPADEQRFWQEMRTSPAQGMRDVRARYRDIDRRLRDIETFVTSSNVRLANEIDSLK